ncbi:hypothetical protein B0O99DRAFT_677550 [Bisporella sp. PMI_857]|nr:hypothetical protein B0O99DRAFT_677550 [Bisporella sp. PMI_857]
MDIPIEAPWPRSPNYNLGDGSYHMIQDFTLFSSQSSDLDYTSNDLGGLLSTEALVSMVSPQDLMLGDVDMQVENSSMYPSLPKHSDVLVNESSFHNCADGGSGLVSGLDYVQESWIARPSNHVSPNHYSHPHQQEPSQLMQCSNVSPYQWHPLTVVPTDVSFQREPPLQSHLSSPPEISTKPGNLTQPEVSRNAKLLNGSQQPDTTTRTSSARAALRGNVKSRRRQSLHRAKVAFTAALSSKKTKSSTTASPASASYGQLDPQEAIALFAESIRNSNYSPTSQRHLMNLLDQAGQVIQDEKKYGSSHSIIGEEDDSMSSGTSSRKSLWTMEIVDSDSSTDTESVTEPKSVIDDSSDSSDPQPLVNGDQEPSPAEPEKFHNQRHTICIDCGVKTLYSCTFDECDYCTHLAGDWKRHESTAHSLGERYMCLECTGNPQTFDVNGNPICQFCNTSFITLPRVHYLQCASTQSRRKGVFTRRDHLIEHLHKKHNMAHDTRQLANDGRFPVNRNFPRHCGFCDFTFQNWEERLGHIEEHYEDGRLISEWRRPRHRSRNTHSSGHSSQPKDDDDDSDDDFNGGTRKPPRKSSRPNSKLMAQKQQRRPTNRSQASGSTPEVRRKGGYVEAKPNRDDRPQLYEQVAFCEKLNSDKNFANSEDPVPALWTPPPYWLDEPKSLHAESVWIGGLPEGCKVDDAAIEILGPDTSTARDLDGSFKQLQDSNASPGRGVANITEAARLDGVGKCETKEDDARHLTQKVLMDFPPAYRLVTVGNGFRGGIQNISVSEIIRDATGDYSQKKEPRCLDPQNPLPSGGFSRARGKHPLAPKDPWQAKLLALNASSPTKKPNKWQYPYLSEDDDLSELGRVFDKCIRDSRRKSSLSQICQRLRERDQAFIVDNSLSITSHRDKMLFLFNILASTVKKTDTDGVELFFTSAEPLLTSQDASSRRPWHKVYSDSLQGNYLAHVVRLSPSPNFASGQDTGTGRTFHLTALSHEILRNTRLTIEQWLRISCGLLLPNCKEGIWKCYQYADTHNESQQEHSTHTSSSFLPPDPPESVPRCIRTCCNCIDSPHQHNHKRTLFLVTSRFPTPDPPSFIPRLSKNTAYRHLTMYAKHKK